MLKAVILAGATLLSGCTAPQDGPPQDVPKPESEAVAQGFLTAAEIRGFFEDGTVLLEPAMEDSAEVFEPNGGYTRWGRPTSQGTYRVGEGVLCVQTSRSEEYCRSVFRDDGGQLFLGDAPGLKQPAWPVAFVALKE